MDQISQSVHPWKLLPKFVGDVVKRQVGKKQFDKSWLAIGESYQTVVKIGRFESKTYSRTSCVSRVYAQSFTQSKRLKALV